MRSNITNKTIHIAGSILFLCIPILSSPGFSFSFDFIHVTFFQREFVTYLLLLAFFYACYSFFVPRLWFEKKYLLFSLSVMASYACLLFLPEMVLWANPLHNNFRFHGHHHRGFEIMHFLEHGSVQFLLVLIFAFLLRMRDRLKQSEQAKTQAELSYLKAQINPHFLFNTLNSIYSLALEKSDKTAESIVKLSGMMRYVLTESQHDFVSLEKEINYITDYVDLQKLRLENTAKIDYKVDGSLGGKSIAPLLLIPFVENAFKYGVNPEEKSDLTINIHVNPTHLVLTVSNKKVKTNMSAYEKSGLGVENTRNRLKLLYPGKHFLQIKDENGDFNVHLSIDLK